MLWFFSHAIHSWTIHDLSGLYIRPDMVDTVRESCPVYKSCDYEG